MYLKCDAVFEGGGVRGIGHVGAVRALENAGYEFENLAGSSCGAIVAGLLAVGYRAAEIRDILKTLDYSKFEMPTGLDRFGAPGKIMNLIWKFGIYSTDYFHAWFSDLLKQKGKTTFGDLKNACPTQEKYRYRLQVTASDITTQRLLTLPQDLCQFGLDPDAFSIAAAVRMSMSIPFFYMPHVLTDSHGAQHSIVDGGLLSNYPIWMLDDGTSNPPFPTFGFKFTNGTQISSAPDALACDNILTYSRFILATLLNASDNQHISESRGDLQRSILIPVTISDGRQAVVIKSTDFSITQAESDLLYQNGYRAGVNFLSTWNFADWKRSYRTQSS